MTDQTTASYEFDVAVSFAGEDREYVEDVVEALKTEHRVFYDKDYEVEAWGEDGVEYFTNVYMNRARYVLIFVSQNYAAKMWTRLERRSALAKAATQKSAYVLPIRLESVDLEGLLPTVIYLDARRLGVEGVAAAVKRKLSSIPAPTIDQSVLDGAVPKTNEQIEALVTERPRLWEHLLYGALLRTGMEALEPKYHDHAIGYANRNGQSVTHGEIVAYCHTRLDELSAILDNFNAVLHPDFQERAFGRPGEEGDAGRITHLAQRFVSVYEDFMDWAASLRGTTASNEPERKALRLLARFSEQPVEECRDFVGILVRELDTANARIDAGEKVRIDLSLALKIDDEVSDAFNDALEEASQ